MNGPKESLKFFSTKHVLSKYAFPTDVLEAAQAGLEEPSLKKYFQYIQVYRKRSI
jgi:hypothetical protein